MITEYWVEFQMLVKMQWVKWFPSVLIHSMMPQGNLEMISLSMRPHQSSGPELGN